MHLNWLSSSLSDKVSKQCQQSCKPFSILFVFMLWKVSPVDLYSVPYGIPSSHSSAAKLKWINELFPMQPQKKLKLNRTPASILFLRASALYQIQYNFGMDPIITTYYITLSIAYWIAFHPSFTNCTLSSSTIYFSLFSLVMAHEMRNKEKNIRKETRIKT